MPSTDPKLTGATIELAQILDQDDVLVCTRDWSAWQYGTMSENDFESYSEGLDNPDSGVCEILAWRDAAVETFRRALIDHFMSTESQMLGLPSRSEGLVGAWCDVIADFEPKD